MYFYFPGNTLKRWTKASWWLQQQQLRGNDNWRQWTWQWWRNPLPWPGADIPPPNQAGRRRYHQPSPAPHLHTPAPDAPAPDERTTPLRRQVNAESERTRLGAERQVTWIGWPKSAIQRSQWAHTTSEWVTVSTWWVSTSTRWVSSY